MFIYGKNRLEGNALETIAAMAEGEACIHREESTLALLGI
jgi:hypothetical protein